MRSTTRSHRARGATVCALVAALVAVGCGGDDDASNGATDEASAAVPDDSADQPGSSGSPDGDGADGGGDGAAGGDDLVIGGETVAPAKLLSAARDEGGLTLYTTSTEEGALAIADAFTEDTGVDVEVFRAPGSELTQRVLAETGGGVHAFDAVALTSPDDMITLKDKGLLARYEMPEFHPKIEVTDEIDEDRTFYPLYAWFYIIAINRGVVGDDVEVDSWDDIVNPEFEGALGITPAGVGGTGVAQAAFQEEVLGEEYWSKLGDVDPVVFSTTSTVAESLTRGEITAAILAESAIVEAVADGAPIEMVYPDEGIIAGVSYQAVAAKAEHPNAARLYQRWSLSNAGQDAIATEAGARPIRTDAVDADVEGADMPPRSELNVWWSDLQQRRATQDELVKRWNQAVGYTE